MTIRHVHLFSPLLALALVGGIARPQYTPSPAPSAPVPLSTPSPATATDPTSARLDAMARLLLNTQQQLLETQQQLNQLRTELDQLRAPVQTQLPAQPQLSTRPQPAANPAAQTDNLSSSSAATSLAVQLAHQQEEQEILAAQVKQHDQTKLESLSKYPVRVYGLLLFNTFADAGAVDNPDLPSIALRTIPDQSHGSVGASFRQTILGISANGPRVFGARTSGDLSVDFFGDPSYNFYGSSNGNLRLRRGDIRLAWGDDSTEQSSRDELRLGIDGPLISPLSPTSFATVANPALAWSGNLWVWAPELQVKHTFALSSTSPLAHTLELEGGLWDPPAVGSIGPSSSRILSPGELARQPGFLTRLSLHGPSADRPFDLGIGGFSDRQTFYQGQTIQLWAVTADWQLPLTHRFQLDGELYRGRGLGGLGGGAYKDTLTGTDPVTGLPRTLGLNAAGGWTQWKTRLPHDTEANFIYGQDGGFAADFRRLNLATNPYVLEPNARTQSIVANFIYRPKTYLILSPEYRRLRSWQITGPAATANIYTLSAGYQF